MKRKITVFATAAILVLGTLGVTSEAVAHGSGSAQHEGQDDHHMSDLERMREMHRGHEHGHDFEAMEEMSEERRGRILALMHEIGLAMPPMDSGRGRQLFVAKGCVACHSVNGVGGAFGPSLNAADMPRPMNVFEFAARMWRGAQAMTMLQEDMLGEVISLDGQDLADLIAFAHDAEEQARLTEDQIPDRYRAHIDDE